MANIPYHIVPKGQPGQAGGGTYKYYPTLLPRRKITEAEVMAYMDDVYNVKRGEYKKVVAALQETILHFLAHSNHIELGEVGYVNLSIKASGDTDPEKVGLKDIKKASLHLRFSKIIKEGLGRLVFEKATKRELARKTKRQK